MKKIKKKTMNTKRIFDYIDDDRIDAIEKIAIKKLKNYNVCCYNKNYFYLLNSVHY